MITHINAVSLAIAATTTSAATAYPASWLDQVSSFDVFNPDTTNALYVASGATPVAAAGGAFVEPGKTRTFFRNKDDAKIALKYAGGSGATVLIQPISVTP